MIPISVLDLSPIIQGGTARQSLHNSLDLARHAERWGYARYWLAEHHNVPAVASAATSVVIAHVAGGTSTIRVGAGGLMLALNIVAAESDRDAQRLFTSYQQLLLRLGRGHLGAVPPPVDPDRFQAELTPIERVELHRTEPSVVVGSPETVRAGVADFIS